MQFEKQLPGNRSRLAFAMRRDARTITSRYASTEAGPRLRSYPAYRPPAEDWPKGDDRALRESSEDGTSWRAIPVAVSGLMAKALAGFAACAEAAFPNFLVAVMSWTFAEALAGCAAYGEAMYPGLVASGEPGDRHDPAGGPQSRLGIPKQLQSQTSRLSEICPIVNDEFRSFGPLSRSGQNRSSATVLVEAEYIVRPEGTRAVSAGRMASITSLIAKFRSRMRREWDRRLAMTELRALDERTLRDIGICRYDIEYFARRGDRCE